MEKETWEEEFEKWVIKDRLNYISNRVYAPPLPYYEDIKSFIRQTLASQKEKMLGVIDSVKKDYKVRCDLHGLELKEKYGVCSDCDCAKAHKLGMAEMKSGIKKKIGEEI